MGKLTPARRRALEWFFEHGTKEFWHVAISHRLIANMEKDGLLEKVKPIQQFGFVRYTITDAGRQALKGGDA